MRYLVTQVGIASLVLASCAAATQAVPATKAAPTVCAAHAPGYLKAKIAGAIAAEIDWPNKGTTCTGEVRPHGGVRLSFKNLLAPGQPLLIVFGIPGAEEGRNAQSLPVNVTVVKEGSAQFFSTQGDDKCTIDRLEQTLLSAAPRKQRAYSVVVRGFCTEPARAVQGAGAILLSRFDFASELHFGEEEGSEPAKSVTSTAQGHPQ